MESVKGILRVPVHLADAERVIAVVAQQLRHFVAVMLGHLAIPQHAVVPGRQTGEQSGAGRRTAGTRGIGIAEPIPVGSKSVHVRGNHCGISGPAQGISPLLVGHDKDNVWLLLRRHVCQSAKRSGQHGK